MVERTPEILAGESFKASLPHPCIANLAENGPCAKRILRACRETDGMARGGG